LSQGNDTFLATVDCTGHGVPGAFMSVISFRFLNQAVRDFGLEKPSEILNFLNTEIKNTISDKIENEEAKNALDISMVRINKKNKSFEFAGVGQKMIYAKGDELVEIKGDKFHIGQNLDPRKHKITSLEFEIEKDATLYMYSDGFQDQFGGPESKKFGSKRLKEMIGSISNLDLGQQKASVEDTFQTWKNGYDQVDDTLFMGVRLN
jgi:serine phosphatase RsbU (regulator of sigma subunit)